jgi:hypothetical protein
MPDAPPLYVFQCPVMKMNVKVLADNAPPVEGCRLRWRVRCVACGGWHLVNVATGRVRVTIVPNPPPERSPESADDQPSSAW